MQVFKGFIAIWLMGIYPFLVQAQGPSSRFDAAKHALLNHPAVQRGMVAWSFRDVQTGQELDAYQSRKLLCPASIQKLLVTNEIMQVNMPPFETRVGIQGNVHRHQLKGNLVIRGGGDPSLGSGKAGAWTADSVLKAMVKMLSDSGIERIRGNIVVDVSFWPADQRVIPQTWIWEDIGNYYGAGAYGLNWRNNEFEVEVIPAQENLAKPEVRCVSPWALDLALHSGLRTDWNLEPEITGYAAPFADSIWLGGNVRPKDPAQRVRLALPNPARSFGKELMDALERAGIECNGTVLICDTTVHFTEQWMVIHSPLVQELIKETNFTSNNLWAECLGRKLSDVRWNEPHPTGTALNRVIQSRKHRYKEGLQFRDASGLSRGNRLSPAFLSDYLRVQAKEPHAASLAWFMGSIPQAGKEGTVKSIETDAWIRVKSGSMNGIRSYAGYLYDKDRKHQVAFCIISNHVDLPSAELKKHLTELMLGACDEAFQLPLPYAPIYSYRDTLLKMPELQALQKDIELHPEHYFKRPESAVHTQLLVQFSGEPDVDDPYFYASVKTPGDEALRTLYYRINAQKRSCERKEGSETWVPVEGPSNVKF